MRYFQHVQHPDDFIVAATPQKAWWLEKGVGLRDNTLYLLRHCEGFVAQNIYKEITRNELPTWVYQYIDV